MKEFILALDQGTSSSRAMLYDNSGKTISIAQQAIEMSHPKDGWVEQDPNEIWDSVLAAGREAITSSGIDPKFIKGIGITNHLCLNCYHWPLFPTVSNEAWYSRSRGQ